MRLAVHALSALCLSSCQAPVKVSWHSLGNVVVSAPTSSLTSLQFYPSIATNIPVDSSLNH